MVWHECDLYLSGDILLDAVHHGFHIPHHWVQIHRFMHLLAVPTCDLLLPVKLSLRQDMLFEQMVCLYYNHRSCSLESDTSLDSDDGVSDVDVTTYSERSRYVTDCLDHLDRTHLDPVQRYGLTLAESDSDMLRLCLCDLCRICLFWKPAVG